MYVLLLLSAIVAIKLIPRLKDQIQFLKWDLQSKRKRQADLREEWRELITYKPPVVRSSVRSDSVPDYLKEEEATLKKEVLELTEIVSNLRPIKHAND